MVDMHFFLACFRMFLVFFLNYSVFEEKTFVCTYIVSIK